MKKSVRIIYSTLAVLLLAISCFSQKISPADRKKIQEKEDTLREMAYYMIADSMQAGRLLAYKDFVPAFLRALKIKNSFYYPFDSVMGISKLYAPDSSFRIFTWYVAIDDYNGWQRGFIQMKTASGELKGFALFDNSDYTESPEFKVCADSTWIGAVYYNIIKKEYQGKSYYTLFGLDKGSSLRTTRKWIEVLTFNNKGEPVFGGPFFSFQNDSLKKPTQYRFGIEYKKEARTLVNYDPDLDIILYDHLISETNEPEFAWTYVPDGDYEGFKWENGKWVHINKVFDFKLEDGQAPIENPILDKKEDTKTTPPENKKPKKPGGGN